MNLYTVHDKAINSYQGVIALPSERDAVEQFRVVCNQPDTAFFKHAPDFTLLQVGTFDPESGVLTPIHPKLIVNAVSLLEKPHSSKTLSEPKKKAPTKKGKTK